MTKLHAVCTISALVMMIAEQNYYPSADASSVCTLSLIDKTCNGVINQISFWIYNVTNVALLFKKNRKNQESVENYRHSISNVFCFVDCCFFFFFASIDSHTYLHIFIEATVGRVIQMM